jgi:hypothetical protein
LALWSSRSWSAASAVISQAVTAAPFQQAWVEANRVAHTELAKVLEGEQAGVVLNTDSITVDLGPFIAQVKQRTSLTGPASTT